MSEVLTYDPSKVTLTIGGTTVTGFATDTKITISRTNGIAGRTEGVDGDLSINIDPRTSGTLVFSLLHNAAFNDLVYAWLEVVRTSGNPVAPLYFEDPSGQYVDTVCWFETQGDYTMSQETSNLDWTLGIADATLRPVDSEGILGAIQAATIVGDLT